MLSNALLRSIRTIPVISFFVHCFENMTSNEQTQAFSRVVFAISALMACEVALLSQKVIKIDSKQSSWVTLESTGSNEIGRLLLGIS